MDIEKLLKSPHVTVVAHKYKVVAHPHARQVGAIYVPPKYEEDDEMIKEYIADHFDQIEFEEPELNYGREFDFYKDYDDDDDEGEL